VPINLSRVLLGSGVAAAAVGAYWMTGFFLQRALLFPARRFAFREPPAGWSRLWVGPPAERVEAWFRPPKLGASPAPLLLFAHGNAELIDDWPEEFGPPQEWGLGVLLVEYPGYGRSPGGPSQRSITRGLVAAYDWAAANPAVDPQRIVAYGRSLGGAAAAILARERPVAALVLESAFTGVRPLARRFGLPGWLVRDPFDNVAALGSFRGPVLLLHGERDDVIPANHSRRLQAAAHRGELHLLPCGHNDCPRPWPLLRRFLDRERILPPPASRRANAPEADR
jgi:hypothetical protein